jgi:triacylglycerol lipase
VRYYISHHRPENLGRVVMLSPPNRGSEAADHLRDSALYKWLNSPAEQQLITGPEGLPEQLGPVDFPLGIITGNQHSFFDAWLADVIPGTDDGKVSVEQAKVEGMADFLVLPYSHPFIMNAQEVIDQTLHFLREGPFGARSPSAEASSD